MGRLRFLLLLFENRPGYVANTVDLRPVDLRPGLGFMPWPTGRRSAPLQYVGAHTLGFVHLDGTRVRLLLRDSYRRESIQNLLALHFQLTR